MAQQLAGQYRRHAGRRGVEQLRAGDVEAAVRSLAQERGQRVAQRVDLLLRGLRLLPRRGDGAFRLAQLPLVVEAGVDALAAQFIRSEEHPSELQSLMRISYDVFCLKKKNK